MQKGKVFWFVGVFLVVGSCSASPACMSRRDEKEESQFRVVKSVFKDHDVLLTNILAGANDGAQAMADCHPRYAAYLKKTHQNFTAKWLFFSLFHSLPTSGCQKTSVITCINHYTLSLWQ